MRVLLIVFNTVGRGTYRRAYEFGRHLAADGHSVSLLATARHARLHVATHTIDGVQVVESPDLFSGSLRSGWDPFNTLTRIRWLAGLRFDIVHAFESRPTVIFPALFAVRRSHAALIMDWADWFGRGGSVEQRPNPVIRTVVRPVETYFENGFRSRAQGTTVICTTLRAKALALGVKPDSIRLLRNGCDLEHLVPIDTSVARLRVGLAGDGLIVGYVGSIFRTDAEFMAKSFDLLTSTRSNVRLLVIGYCPVNLRSMLKSPDQVIQTGPIPESALNDYLAASDVCWLPLGNTSANRGRWPLKLNDYMAVGRPTVATAVGDVTDLMRAHPIGLLAKDEPDDFAAQTLRLLGDVSLRAELGVNARAVAITQFDWAQLTRQLVSLYNDSQRIN